MGEPGALAARLHRELELAKELHQAPARRESLGLTDDEVAFYDALEANDSAVQVLGDETLRIIACEPVAAVRANVTINWTVRENVRAQLRVLVKRILRKYGYPPDKQEKATQTVLEQAEVLCGRRGRWGRSRGRPQAQRPRREAGARLRDRVGWPRYWTLRAGFDPVGFWASLILAACASRSCRACASCVDTPHFFTIATCSSESYSPLSRPSSSLLSPPTMKNSAGPTPSATGRMATPARPEGFP
jgi:hypothetical protein